MCMCINNNNTLYLENSRAYAHVSKMNMTMNPSKFHQRVDKALIMWVPRCQGAKW